VAPGGNGRTDVRSGAQSVERALAVLHCFERADRSLGVSELAAATGLTVSTTHRLTRALCAGGLLMQDPRSERYQLGPMVVVLGRRAEEHLGYARALPTLEALAESTGESVNLGIRSGAEVLVVRRLPPWRSRARPCVCPTTGSRRSHARSPRRARPSDPCSPGDGCAMGTNHEGGGRRGRGRVLRGDRRRRGGGDSEG
jgi:hypothetical protein